VIGAARGARAQQARAVEARGQRVRARLVMSVGWRLALLTVLVGSTALYVLAIPHTHGLLFDFKGGLYNAGRAIIHGHSPYQPAFLAHQAAIIRAGGIAQGETPQHAFSIPVYPAPANLAVIPLSLLPFWLAGTLYTLLCVAAMILGLRLLGVSDWRCIALALVSWPFAFGLDLGAVGPLLVLGAGIAWRWRARLWPPAIAIAALVVTKIFPWPLCVWLLITRRFRTLALTVAIATVATVAAWAAIGFDGFAQYPQMLSNLSFIQEGRATSLVAVLLAVGLPAGAAGAVALGTAAAMLGLAWRIARRPGGERKAFGLAIFAALTATPIVWDHYMVLLFVPIALASPRRSAIWFLPLCTPLVIVTSAALVPLSSRFNIAHPDTLRSAVLWLVLEGLVVAKLCFNERSEFRAVRSRLRFGRRRTPTGASIKGV